MTDEVWGVAVISRDAAALLGEPSHIVQVRAIVRAKSRAAAARALIAANLGHGSETAVANYIRDYGGPTGNKTELAVASEPGRVFVGAMSHHTAYTAWPPVTVDAPTGDTA